MWGGTRVAHVACATTVAAMILTVLPLAATPGGATSAPAPIGEAGADADDGFVAVEKVVTLDPDRVVEVAVDDDDHHENAGAATGASAEVVHHGEPEVLVISDVEPEATLAVRSRNDGEWSEWVEVTANPDEAPDGLPGEEGASSPVGIGPIWIGHDAERTEIAVLHGDVDRITVEELRSEPVETAGPTTDDSGTVSAAATAGRPPIRPRSDWATSSMGWKCSGQPSRSDNLRAAVVHHTASTTSYSQADVPGLLRAFWRYHVENNGWCDVAYNFFVDRFGTIWEGRLGGIDQPVIGGHARGFNTWTAGVALVGEFGSAPAYTAMIESTERLLAWKLSLHGVDPLGWTELENRATTGRMRFPGNAVIHTPTILGHRDLGLTSCPGSNVYATLDSIRRALATSERIGSPPYVFDRWQASSTNIAVATVDRHGGIRVAGAAPQTTVRVSGTPVAIDGGEGRGYVLTTDGRLTAFGGAPIQAHVSVGTPVDLVVRRDGRSGWVLHLDGRLAPFGGAPLLPAVAAGNQAVAADLDDSGRGYVLLGSGALAPVNGAPGRGVSTGGAAAVDLAVRADGTSGWVLTTDGVSRGFGGAATASRPGGASSPRALLVSGDESGPTILDADGRLWPVGGAPAVMPMASHVGFPTAIDAGRIGRPGLTTSPLATVVAAQHELFLRTRPTPPELERWYHRTERVGRVGAALGMARSDAYAGLIIDDLYRRVLGRAADPAGRAGWLDAIRNGMRIETIASAFYGSREYVNGAGSISRYVELLYENLLFRSSDPTGKAHWTSALEQGRMTPTQVAAGFYGSLESRRDRVTRLYDRILDRTPDPGGLAHWADQLITRDDLVLAAELAGSQEFYNRALQGS